MFETKVSEVSSFLCVNANLKALGDTWSFDDRSGQAAFVIKPTGTIRVISEKGWSILKKPYKIYIQYKNEQLINIIAVLNGNWLSNGNTILSIVDDNKTAFQDLMQQDYSNQEFNFAYILVELSLTVPNLKCLPTC